MISFHGQLRHHFWGDYTATVVLGPTEGGATGDRHLRQLRAQLPRHEGLSLRDVPGALCIDTDGHDGHDVLVAWLEEHRVGGVCPHPGCRGEARRHAIDGLDHSVDCGPRFEFEIVALDLLTPTLPFPPKEAP